MKGILYPIILFVFAVVGVGLLISRLTPPETVKIYKTTTPLSKQTENRDQTSPTCLDIPPKSRPQRAEAPSEETQRYMSIMDLPPNENPETAAAEDVPVSPHGFGPYPDVPSDYFRTPVWAYPDSEFTPGHELIERVLIKLWKHGIYSDGGSIENGRVYPVTRGTVYVKWKADYISDYIGHPDDDDEQIISTLEDKGTPKGITVLDYDTAGIDPYLFLNLELHF